MSGSVAHIAKEAPGQFEIIGPVDDFHVQVQVRSDGDRSAVWVIDGDGISVCQMQGQPDLRVLRAEVMAASLRNPNPWAITDPGLAALDQLTKNIVIDESYPVLFVNVGFFFFIPIFENFGFASWLQTRNFFRFPQFSLYVVCRFPRDPHEVCRLHIFSFKEMLQTITRFLKHLVSREVLAPDFGTIKLRRSLGSLGSHGIEILKNFSILADIVFSNAIRKWWQQASLERTQEEEYPKKPGPYSGPASFIEIQ